MLEQRHYYLQDACLEVDISDSIDGMKKAFVSCSSGHAIVTKLGHGTANAWTQSEIHYEQRCAAARGQGGATGAIVVRTDTHRLGQTAKDYHG